MAAELRLHDGKAVFDNYPDDRLSLEGITHVISTTYDFQEYETCVDNMIPVVRPTWVQHSLAKDRLQNPRQYSPDPSHFMSDVVACVAGLPPGDEDAIAGGILAMGGLWSSKLTNQITHIIALAMDSDTVQAALRKKVPVKVVLPHWVDDCLKLGRKIDEQPYTLPDADLLQGPPEKPPIGKRRTNVEGAIHPDPWQLSQEPVTPRKLQNVFKNKTILLSTDLGISTYLRDILHNLISEGGGSVATNISKADMYIGKYREGDNYKLASRNGKDVGNLTWLYYLIQTDKWTSPFGRMLHYPIAKDGLPGFKGLLISLSNYSGDARQYLENLITATGAVCTKTLKQDNTHLITAHDQSEKCAAAREWGVQVVNHLWLEESYARWKKQNLTDTRYTHFPQRTNLGDIVGHTRLDRTILQQNFFPDSDLDVSDIPTKTPMRQVNQNIIKSEQLPSNKRVKSEVADKTNVSSPGPEYKTPAHARSLAPGKENMTPSTTHSRKSKDVAASRLQEAAEDMLLYKKESMRKGGVVYGGRRKSDLDRVEIGRKRSMEEMEDVASSDDSEAKKLKRNPDASMRLIISKYERWVGKPKVEERDKVTFSRQIDVMR
jgi:hypothetical protein